LDKLNPGGVAYFQLPTYCLNYRFKIDEYLRDASATGNMEMHILPQYRLFDLLDQCDCWVLECREDAWTGIDHMISNSLFVKKRG
jgi:hypothetical protein